MDYYAQRIHRVEYKPTKRGRCMIKLETPTRFKRATVKAMPTQAQACMFQKLPEIEGETEASELAEKHGWAFLGCGIHRCAVKYKKGGILKLAFNAEEARGANQYEVATYAIAEDKVKEVFTPVVAHSPTFKWLVVPEARTMANDSLSWDKLRDIGHKIQEHLDSVGANCTDLHRGNLGLLDNKPVIIDFGFGVVCKRREQAKPKERKLREFIETRYPTKLKGGRMTQRRELLLAQAYDLRMQGRDSDANLLSRIALYFGPKISGKIPSRDFSRALSLLNPSRRRKFYYGS